MKPRVQSPQLTSRSRLNRQAIPSLVGISTKRFSQHPLRALRVLRGAALLKFLAKRCVVVLKSLSVLPDVNGDSSFHENGWVLIAKRYAVVLVGLSALPEVCGVSSFHEAPLVG